MTQAGKVAEIFTTAGDAFTKLGTLAMTLQAGAERPQDGSKWGEEEIEMMRTAVKKFGNDVERISPKIKSKSTAQLKTAIKQKALQSNPGVAISPVKVSVANTISAPLVTLPKSQLQAQSVSRLIGQKSKALPIQMSIRSATPMSTQMTGKKIRLDPSGMSVLTSISPAPINTLIRQNTPVAIAPNNSAKTLGVPIMASSQGFQVIVPPHKTAVSGATVLPVSLIQPGIVQRVSNSNSTGNVDVES